MKASVHAKFSTLLFWASFALGIPVAYFAVVDDRVMIAIILAYVIFYAAVLFWLPVRCACPGCNGSMHRSLFRLSFLKSNLKYHCENCGQGCDHPVFFPSLPI